MKNLKTVHFFIIIVLAFMSQTCSKDSSDSSEDLTKTIIGNYKCMLTTGTTITATDIPTVITRENNNTIKIAITGRETVFATVSKFNTYFLINVKDQTGITEGSGGDFGSNEINFGFKKTGTTEKLNYYGTKSL